LPGCRRAGNAEGVDLTDAGVRDDELEAGPLADGHDQAQRLDLVHQVRNPPVPLHHGERLLLPDLLAVVEKRLQGAGVEVQAAG
jgi:hypothetical protein